MEKCAAKAKKTVVSAVACGCSGKADYSLLPLRQMFLLMMEDAAGEFNLIRDRRIRLMVTRATVDFRMPNQQVAGVVEVFDDDDASQPPGRSLGMLHIYVANSYGSGFRLDTVARGGGTIMRRWSVMLGWTYRTKIWRWASAWSAARRFAVSRGGSGCRTRVRPVSKGRG